VSLEEKRGDGFGKKRKERVEEIEDFGRGGLWGTKKFYWKRILEGLYGFFKFNLCYYNILKIKIILIININSSFYKKKLFQKL